jgi:deoxycytidine triphosphate deaminase
LGQICFFHVRDVQVSYGEKKSSKYARRLGVELTRIEEDPEILG